MRSVRLPGGDAYPIVNGEEPIAYGDSSAGEILIALIHHTRPKIVVEVGIAYGINTARLAWNLPKDSTLYALELKVEPCAREIIEAYSLSDRVIFIEGDSKNTARTLPDGLGLVYVDGDHSIPGVTADYDNLWPKMAPGGIMVFHDVSAYCGVRDFVPKVLPHAIYLPMYQGLAIIQKRPEYIVMTEGGLRSWG